MKNYLIAIITLFLALSPAALLADWNVDSKILVKKSNPDSGTLENNSVKAGPSELFDYSDGSPVQEEEAVDNQVEPGNIEYNQEEQLNNYAFKKWAVCISQYDREEEACELNLCACELDAQGNSLKVQFCHENFARCNVIKDMRL